VTRLDRSQVLPDQAAAGAEVALVGEVVALAGEQQEIAPVVPCSVAVAVVNDLAVLEGAAHPFLHLEPVGANVAA
jgi:hypothetical protein